MLNIAFANFDTMIVLAVLAGSLLGSTMTYLGRRPVVDDGPFSGVRANPYGYERPSDWPEAGRGATKTASYYETPRRRTGIVAGLFVAGLAFVAVSAGLFAYQSPWSTETDLRHLAASLHCEAASLVGLSGAARGTPGYHIRNDPDQNGFSCEAAAPALSLALLPAGMEGKFSNEVIVWPVTDAEN